MLQSLAQQDSFALEIDTQDNQFIGDYTFRMQSSMRCKSFSFPVGFGQSTASGFGQPQASEQSMAPASMGSPAPFGNSNNANSPGSFVFGATAPGFGSSPAPFTGFGGGGGMSLGASSTENQGPLAQRKRLKIKRPARQ